VRSASHKRPAATRRSSATRLPVEGEKALGSLEEWDRSALKAA
jgi:hypothetical protein